MECSFNNINTMVAAHSNVSDQCSSSSPHSQPSKNLVSQQKSKHTVSFNSEVQSNVYPSIDQYSEEEVEAAWYSQAELHRIQRGNCYTVFLVENGKPINERRYCARGLETETEKGKMEQAGVLQAARATVLNKQSVQRKKGISDPESIALVYGKFSSRYVQEACTRAIEDEKFTSRDVSHPSTQYEIHAGTGLWMPQQNTVPCTVAC